MSDHNSNKPVTFQEKLEKNIWGPQWRMWQIRQRLRLKIHFFKTSLKFSRRDLPKVLVVSPLILLSHDQIGSQDFVPEDPKCTQERRKQFL